MASLTFGGVVYEVSPDESVLDGLLRNGIAIPNSCRAGACQSCLMRSVGGGVNPAAQRGLKPTLVAQGYFLSCICRPDNDLVLEAAGGLEVEANIVELERLTPTVMRVRIQPAAPIAYRPGQYITLRRKDGLARSYSLASHPQDLALELHVRRASQGKMSGWLFDEAKVHEPVYVRGPAGDCFYTADKPEQPLLLAGTGTGLAPLAGICRDAIRHGHRAPIHLYHGALRPEGLYLQDELRDLERNHSNVRYIPVVVEGGAPGGIVNAALDDAILAAHPKLTGFRAFVCGDPSLVQVLKKKLFLAGVASREIFADAFVEAPAT